MIFGTVSRRCIREAAEAIHLTLRFRAGHRVGRAAGEEVKMPRILAPTWACVMLGTASATVDITAWHLFMFNDEGSIPEANFKASETHRVRDPEGLNRGSVQNERATR